MSDTGAKNSSLAGWELQNNGGVGPRGREYQTLCSKCSLLIHQQSWFGHAKTPTQMIDKFFAEPGFVSALTAGNAPR